MVQYLFLRLSEITHLVYIWGLSYVSIYFDFGYLDYTSAEEGISRASEPWHGVGASCQIHYTGVMRGMDGDKWTFDASNSFTVWDVFYRDNP